MKVSLDALISNDHAMMKTKKSPTPLEFAADLDRKPSLSTAPSIWSRSGSTLTSKLNSRITFSFENRAKEKKKGLRQKIQSAFSDIPRIVEVPKEPEFVVVLDEKDVVNEGVESIVIRNTNRLEATKV